MNGETASAELDPALHELATAQADVVSRRQLRELGIDRWQIRNQVRARRWRLIGRRVVVLHRGQLTAEQRRWVAVLHAGPRAVLAGRSALAAAGLQNWPEDAVHVLVPSDCRATGLPGIVIHRSRRLPAADAQPRTHPPRTTVERAAVDAAAAAGNLRTAAGLLAAVVQQRLSTPQRLRAALSLAKRARRRRLLMAVLNDIEGGSEALSEIDFVRLCRRAKLPAPTRQVRRGDRYGRVRYLDACWELPYGRVVTVEVDGAIHLLVSTYWDDMVRANELSLGGDIVLRFPSIAIRAGDPYVLDQLARALSPIRVANRA